MNCNTCKYSRFPRPDEQCPGHGGLICARAKKQWQKNVSKYQSCQFKKSKWQPRGETIRGGKMKIKDFYYEVRSAIKSNSSKKLRASFRADANIILLTSPAPVKILKYAFYKSLSGYNSLEHIFKRSGRLNKEIAFSGIFDEEKMLVSEFIKGAIGDCNGCDWEQGSLLLKSYKKAGRLDKKVSLGHTHPVIIPRDGRPIRPYGAICSKIDYKDEELKNFGDKISLQILASGLNQKYGGDYCVMREMSRTIKLISRYFWILSPRLNQIGVFEVRGYGNIIYHPWQIV